MGSVRKKGCWETCLNTGAVPRWNTKIPCAVVHSPNACVISGSSNLRAWAIHLKTCEKPKECLGIQTVSLVLNYYPVTLQNRRRMISSMFLLAWAYIFIELTADTFWLSKAPNVLQTVDMNHVITYIHKLNRPLSTISKYLCTHIRKMGKNH